MRDNSYETGEYNECFSWKKAPDFTSQAVLANGESLITTTSARRLKESMPLFSSTQWTFVCPSEIIAFANRTAALSELGCEVIAVSIDSHHTHNAWRNTPVNEGGIGPVPFPLVADMTREISTAYGDFGRFDRFLLPARRFHACDLYHRPKRRCPTSGCQRRPRNVDDVVRMVEALQFFEQNGQVCPAGWNKGDSGMTNTPDGVAAYLAENAEKL